MENKETKIHAGDMQLPFLNLHLLNGDLNSPSKTRSEEIRALAEMSERFWLIKNELGFYIGGNKDVLAVLKDPRWHNGVFRLLAMKMGIDPNLENNRRKALLALEGEEHTKIKKHISKSLRGNHVETCTSIATEIIADIMDKKRIDVVSDIASRYPSYVISSTIGIPKSDWPFMVEMTGSLIKHFEGNPGENSKESVDAGNRFFAYMRKIFNEMRRSPVDGNIISELVDAQEEMGLDDYELAIIVGSLYGGGVDTVGCQISMIFDYFLSNPGEYEKFSKRYWDAGVDALETMVGEIMRINSPVRGSVRYASEDIEYRNVIFPKGTFLFLGYSAANMDKSIREKADVVDFELASMYYYQDMTFGRGTHRCPGSFLAKDEITVMLRSFVHVFESIERDGDATYRPSNAPVFGPENLPTKLRKREVIF